MIPETIQALAILVIFVLPGIVYQAVRERYREPVTSDREIGRQVLRAIVVGIALDSLYLIVGGPALINLLAGVTGSSPPHPPPHPRIVGVVGLVLFVLVPATVAVVEAVWSRRASGSRYRTTPTSWDHLFGDRDSCFVRVRLKDGRWVGGWFGKDSYASAFPQDRDIYLSVQYRMQADGRFGERLPATGGVYVAAGEISVLEIIEGAEP